MFDLFIRHLKFWGVFFSVVVAIAFTWGLFQIMGNFALFVIGTIVLMSYVIFVL